MRKRTLMIALALAASPVSLAAQNGVEMDAGARAGAGASMETPDAGARAGGEAALATTIQAGLPEAPVRQVIASGRAKGASAAQIDRAAGEVHARLRASSEALADRGENTAASEADITAGAEALATGARPADLKKLSSSAPRDRSLAASFRALAQLTARGIDPAAASAELAGRLRAGASDAAIANHARRIASSGLPSSAAASVGAAGSLGVAGAAGSIGAGVSGALGVGGL